MTWFATCLAAGLMVQLGMAGPAQGQGPGSGAVPAWTAADSLARLTAAADSAAGADSLVVPALPEVAGDSLGLPPDPLRRRKAEKKPPNVAWTTIRSGILPGWGQLANGKEVKAAVLFGVYGYFAAGAIAAEQDRKDAEAALGGGDDPALVAEVNDAVDRRNGKMWLMGATMVYAMLDAYVDAHFWNYEDEWSARVRPGRDGLPMLALRVNF